MVSKEKCSFTVDDFPTPVLVYSKKDGKILCWNKPARKLLGFSNQDQPSVYQWRGEHKQSRKAKKIDGGCIDLGVIPHITKKGNERLVRVLQKSSIYQGEPCFVNWITDVTDSVQTEMAFANFYGAVTSASIVSMADKKGIITYVNEKFEKISGYSRKELIGQNHRIINSGHHSKKFWVDMWKTIASGKTWRAEVMNRAKDGSYYWVDTFVMPFLDDNGKVEKYLSIRNDITDRKGHEEEITELVRQLSEFNFAINNASIVSRADKKGIISYINDNFIRISGYKAEELIGQNHRIINSGFHPKSFWVTMWKTIASGKTWRAEVKNKAKDGSYYWVDTFIMPFLDEEGKIKEFLSIRNDITKRKAQEEEIILLNHSLADFQNAITSSSIVSRADKKGVITYVNENFVQISGYSTNELIGQNHRIINSGYHTKDFWVNMWKTIASGKTWRADVKNEAKDGTYYWVDTFIMPFLDEEEKVCEFLSIRNDITSRKNTEEELIRSNESLSETLVFGKMGSAQLNLTTFQLTISPELLKLLEETDTTPQTVPLQDFFKKYIKPEYIELVQQRVKEGMGNVATGRNTVNAEFEMVSSLGKTIWIEAKGIFAGNSAFGILHDVTERKEKEQRIIKEREHLNSIINSLPGIFYLFDENGKFLKWNKNFETISQYSAQEIEEMAPLDFFREDEKGLVAQKIGAVFSEGMADVEANFLIKSGRTIPYYFNGFEATFEGRRCLIGMGLDLSDLKNLESESRSRLKMIEMMLNGITDGFFATDRDLNFTMINPAFATLAELAPEEMLGKNILDLYPAFKSSELYGSYQDAIVKQKPLTLELQSGIHSSAVFAVNVYPNSGGLFVYYKDITTSKKAEEKLLETRDLFRRLSANVPGMIYNFYLNENDQGSFPFVSEGSLELFGILAEDIKNDAQVLLRMIHPEDATLVYESIRKAFRAMLPWNAEFRVIMNDGSIKWIAGASNPYKEKNENYYWYGFMHDVTGRKLLEFDKEHSRQEALAKTKQIEYILFSITDYFFAIDRAFNFMWVNPAFAHLQKMTVNDMVGKNMFDLFPRMKDSHLVKRYSASMESQEPLVFEFESSLVKGQFFKVNAYPNPGGLSVYFQDVSDEKIAERAIRKSQTELNAILNASRDSIIYLNRDGIVQVFNKETVQSLERLGGGKIYVGADFKEVLPKPIVAGFIGTFQKALTGEFIEVERQIAWDNNLSTWTLAKYLPIKDAESNTIGVAITISDISERKQAELAIHQSNERLKSLYNCTPAMMHSMNGEGYLVRVSDYWLQKMEFAREEVIGKKSIDFLTPESRKKAIDEILPAFFKNGTVTNVEVDFVTKSGKILNTLLSSNGEYDEQGNFIKSLAVVTDITEKKKLEQEIGKLAFIAKHTSNAVILCDVDGRITWVNEGFRRITEFSLEEVKGKKPGEFLQGPETNQATINFMSRCIASGEGFKEEVLNYGKSGKKYWVDIEVMPIRGDNDELKGFMAIESDITQLKLAITEMLNSQSRLQTMMNNAPMVVFMKDMRNRYTFTNDAFLNTLGITKIKSGYTDYDLFPKEIADEYKLIDLDVAASGKPVAYEHTVNRKQYYTVKFPISDFDGKIYSIGGMSMDVTESKKAERITQESELRLRTILETEPECVKILNEAGQLLEINKAGLEMIETSDFEQVKHHVMAELVHEPYRKDFVELTEKVFQGKTGMLEFKMTGLQGTTRWLETHAVPLRDAEGKIVSLLGVTRDITQRKEAERKLIESEERYRKLFELNPAPTWIYDINTLKFLNVNKAAVEHYGYSQNEFKEMTILNIRPEEEGKRLQMAIEELQTKDFDDSSNFPKLWKHVKKDGTLIDVEVMTTALDSSDRTPRLVTVNDVTEKLKAQNKLMSLVDEKEMLIREIHHRVKNNLQLISSILYIRMSKMQKSEMKDFLNEMRQRIKSIAFLHERLLQSGSINHLDMADYLHKLISDIRLSIESKAVTLAIKTDIESLWMDLDSAIYCGLIMNELITNSIKYAFNGRGHGNIDISLKRVDQKTEFIVADDGIGIELPVAMNETNSNFGMQLLDTFGKQLKAEVMIDNATGTKFKFVF